MNQSADNLSDRNTYGCDGLGVFMMGAVAFTAGVLVGIGTGLLVAPHSGAYTRRQLQNLAEDMKERASLLASDVGEATDRLVEQGKRIVS